MPIKTAKLDAQLAPSVHHSRLEDLRQRLPLVLLDVDFQVIDDDPAVTVTHFHRPVEIKEWQQTPDAVWFPSSSLFSE